MLTLIDVKTKIQLSSHADSLDEILKSARVIAKKAILEFYRIRESYNSYRIEVWTDTPLSERSTTEHIFNVEGVTRRHLSSREKLIEGLPVAHSEDASEEV